MKTISGLVNWGIIGVGDVCEKKSGPAFRKVPNSQLIGVMRRNIEKARDYASRHGVPKYYGSADDLLADPEINAIYVATPPAYHEEYALAAMEAGKPVYIEKPVTLHAGSCERLIEASKALGIRASVAHYRRRLPLFLRIHELIRSGKIGKVNLIMLRLLQSPDNNIVAESEHNWRVEPEISGGGIFHDLAPHQLDILCWLFGEPVGFRGHSFNQGKLFSVPDVTHLEAFFREEIFMEGVWSFNVSRNTMDDRCEIYGNKGMLSFSFFRDPELTVKTGQGTKTERLEYPGHVQQPLIAEVVNYFRGEAPNPSPLEEALWSMRMMDGTLQKR